MFIDTTITESHSHKSTAGLLMLELNVFATLAERGH